MPNWARFWNSPAGRAKRRGYGVAGGMIGPAAPRLSREAYFKMLNKCAIPRSAAGARKAYLTRKYGGNRYNPAIAAGAVAARRRYLNRKYGHLSQY